MQATEFPRLSDYVSKLSARGAGRDHQLYQLIDVYASSEAAAALQAAAACSRDDSGPLAVVLTSASALTGDGVEHELMADDATATRARMHDAVLSPTFLSLIPSWVRQLREVASFRPDTGACTIASALELWSWTLTHFRSGEGSRVPSQSQAVEELVELLSPLLAARCLALDVSDLQSVGSAAAPAQEKSLASDLCHVNAARTAATVGGACAELVFGYRQHLSWDADGCASCYDGDDIDDLEALMPGIASGARMSSDVIEADGVHPVKAGPCARFKGVDSFMRLRNRLDACLTGARLAKDRAASAIARSMNATTTNTAPEVTA